MFNTVLALLTVLAVIENNCDGVTLCTEAPDKKTGIIVVFAFATRTVALAEIPTQLVRVKENWNVNPAANISELKNTVCMHDKEAVVRAVRMAATETEFKPGASVSDQLYTNGRYTAPVDSRESSRRPSKTPIDCGDMSTTRTAIGLGEGNTGHEEKESNALAMPSWSSKIESRT